MLVFRLLDRVADSKLATTAGIWLAGVVGWASAATDSLHTPDPDLLTTGMIGSVIGIAVFAITVTESLRRLSNSRAEDAEKRLMAKDLALDVLRDQHYRTLAELEIYRRGGTPEPAEPPPEPWGTEFGHPTLIEVARRMAAEKEGDKHGD